MTRKCVEKGCKKEARWRAGDGEALSWCKQHALPGAEEHAGLGCVGADCDGRAVYASTTLQRPRWCFRCREPKSVISSVDVAAEIAGKYCKHEACMRVYKLTKAGCCEAHTTTEGLLCATVTVGPRKKLPEHMQLSAERDRKVCEKREQRRQERHESWAAERAEKVAAEDPRNAPGYDPMHTVFPKEWQGLRWGHGADLKYLPPGELPLEIREREKKVLSRKRKRDEAERKREYPPVIAPLRVGRGEVVHGPVDDARRMQFDTVATLFHKQFKKTGGRGVREYVRDVRLQLRSTGPRPSSTADDKSTNRGYCWEPHAPLECVPVEDGEEEWRNPSSWRECRAGRTPWTAYFRCCSVIRRESWPDCDAGYEHTNYGRTMPEVYCDHFATFAWPDRAAHADGLRFCWRHGPPAKVTRGQVRCAHPNCQRWARCGKPRKWCTEHAPEEDNIDRKHAMCKKCGKKRPSFAMEVTHKPVWCGGCKPEGAKNAVRAKCDVAGCGKRPRVSADVPQQAYWCAKCASADAADPQANVCQWVDRTGARSCTAAATHYLDTSIYPQDLISIGLGVPPGQTSKEVETQLQAQPRDARFCETHCKLFARGGWGTSLEEWGVPQPKCHSPGCSESATKCEDADVTKRHNWCEDCATTGGFVGPRNGTGYTR